MRVLPGVLRPAYLILTPACISLGLGLAYYHGVSLQWQKVLLVMAGGLCAHISVNALNEYWDYQSGLDAMTSRTPFSGGSGTLPEHPNLAPWSLALGIACAFSTIAVGLLLLTLQINLMLLPVGFLGILLVVLYSPWFTRLPWPGLLAPGLGFGPCMVIGTEAALNGTVTPASWWVSLLPLFLVSNLQLLNQYPDVEADSAVGRRTYPMVMGRVYSSYIYGLFFSLAVLTLASSVSLDMLPPGCLAGFLGLVAGLPVLYGLSRHSEDIDALIPYMRLNVVVCIATPTLTAAGTLFS